jgi:NAD(P)H dehydrogenase (quinone)
MKYLLIYCHSNPKSFTHAMFQTIFNSLKSRNVEVQVIDLYAEHFNPVLLVDETHRRRDLHLDPQTAVYRKMIEEADHLIFFYPVWWHGFPAILKGFIDRVIASDFVYSFKEKPKGSLFPKGLMPDKKISCFYSLDAPFLVALLDPGWLAIKHGLFKYCGFRNVRRFYRSGLKHLTDLKRKQWLIQCEKIAKTL